MKKYTHIWVLLCKDQFVAQHMKREVLEDHVGKNNWEDDLIHVVIKPYTRIFYQIQDMLDITTPIVTYYPGHREIPPEENGEYIIDEEDPLSRC